MFGSRSISAKMIDESSSEIRHTDLKDYFIFVFFQKIKLNDLQIENLKRTMTHASLTDQEIGALPEGTKVTLHLVPLPREYKESFFLAPRKSQNRWKILQLCSYRYLYYNLILSMFSNLGILEEILNYFHPKFRVS